MWQANETISTRSQFSAAGLGAQSGLEQALLLRVLDEVDYGVLVIDGQGRLRHANHLARHEMVSARLIMNHGNTLLGTTTDFTVQIQQALEHALRGQRRLVSLRSASRELSLAFIPLSHPLETDEPLVLVLLSRQSACVDPRHRGRTRRGPVHGAQPDQGLARKDRLPEHPVDDAARQQPAAGGARLAHRFPDASQCHGVRTTMSIHAPCRSLLAPTRFHITH